MSTDPKRRRILAASPAAGLLTIDESHPAAQHPVADPEPKVRLAYLKNSHPGVVKPMQVYKLCCDEVPEIARLAVTSPLLSDDNKTHLLKYHPQLAEHPDAHIRSVVAGWPGLGASRLAVLAHDDNPHVRAAALTNAGCSAETVFEGALDHNDHVRHAALRSPNLPQGAVAKAITSDDPHDRAVLASNGSVLTPDQKGVLAFDTNQYVRATLVEAYGAKDAALVQAAATDTHWRPRRSAARVSTSVTLLKTLGEDPDPRVSQTAKHNASYPAPA
jgi:hypothetical protein